MSKPVNPLNFEESEKLLNEILAPGAQETNPNRNFRNHLITLLMLDAGLRVGEAVQLTIGQLWQFDQAIATLDLRAEQTKTKQPRSIPLTSRTRAAIRKYLLLSGMSLHKFGDDMVFTNPRNQKALTTRTMEYMIEKAAIAALGRKIHPHQLRHTFATNLMRVCPMPIVQKLLGHKRLSSTQVYQHPNNLDLTNAIDAMQNVNSLENSQKT